MDRGPLLAPHHLRPEYAGPRPERSGTGTGSVLREILSGSLCCFIFWTKKKHVTNVSCYMSRKVGCLTE